MCACSGNMSKRVVSAQLVRFAAEARESDWQLLKLTLHGCSGTGGLCVF